MIVELGIVSDILAAAGSVFTLSDTADLLAEKINDRNRRDKIQMDNSADAISDYALNRADNFLPMPTSSNTGGAIPPRLLVLPCPDNASDSGVMDGVQDAPCGIYESRPNRTHDILDSGSRFGLLPQSVSVLATILNVAQSPPRAAIGLGNPFTDGGGNRYWYALARNVAPRRTYDSTALATLTIRPLNLHHLANISDTIPNSTITTGWLEAFIKVSPVSPGIESVATLSNIAAVIIAPGANRGPRIRATIAGSPGIPALRATASLFLDNIVITTSGGNVNLQNNHNRGRFVDAPPRGNFDDRIVYVSAEEWWREGGEFVRRYKNKTGITDIHNRPAPDSPLEKIQKIIVAYHNLVGLIRLRAKCIYNTYRTCRRHAGGKHCLNDRIAAADNNTNG